MHSQNQHLGLGIVLQHLPGRFETVQPRHAYVHYGDVGFQSAHLIDGFAAIACFTTYFPAWLLFQDGTKPLAHHFVIVRHQHSQSCRSSHVVLPPLRKSLPAGLSALVGLLLRPLIAPRIQRMPTEWQETCHQLGTAYIVVGKDFSKFRGSSTT